MLGVKVISWRALVDQDARTGDGKYSSGPAFERVAADIQRAIAAVVWPPGSKTFSIRPESGKRRGEGNGVGAIKLGFQRSIVQSGWTLEQRAPVARNATEATLKGSRPGAFDAYLLAPDDQGTLPFVVEWETGNISSSHRAINRIGLGIFDHYVSGGALILPSAKLAPFLTDRIGNEPELRPYHSLWEQWTKVDPAYFAIIAVEHDATDLGAPRIPKMTDGRAAG
jgi:hypothetical protein